jgi:hypothetical protein
MATDIQQPGETTETAEEQRRRAEAIRKLLATWLADESGYDERVWPELKRALEENHMARFSTAMRWYDVR